ncbi:predicted protein [Histoplasma capsulatum var. duboisii H88]|uniref:Predicted protein n=2 Tax=Ajellomyces capsulatus TaxID=5037 RepID=F0U9D9_AJEC8|nr:predicted protein [Histoplasma capsulatum H143]EGC41881.1 predicted protein [Histoplasma capsulatum var. duboisii H88]
MDPAEGRSEGPQPPMVRSTSPRSRGTQRDFCMDVNMCIPAASAKDKDMTLFHHSSITVPSQSHSRTPFPFWVFVSLVAGGKAPLILGPSISTSWTETPSSKNWTKKSVCNRRPFAFRSGIPPPLAAPSNRNAVEAETQSEE